ncbi:hypothetical protein E2C01_029775 [Portunus trituberculatus]|uniref:Uncharacterized protein n=1 Tax=Portunus trituberculatus TaxID=210409 RepID=A0A5B7ENS5_PORTR|nr:hypothetical protein [Portunus trituberculatus]
MRCVSHLGGPSRRSRLGTREDEDKGQRTPKQCKKTRVDSIFMEEPLPRKRVDKMRQGESEQREKNEYLGTFGLEFLFHEVTGIGKRSMFLEIRVEEKRLGRRM